MKKYFYDVRNLGRKIRDDAVHKLNSPWNVAVDLNVERQAYRKWWLVTGC